MRKLIVAVVVVCSMVGMEVKAQSQYNNAIGLRMGSSGGIEGAHNDMFVTFKHFLDKSDAIELMAGAHSFGKSFGFSGLYERHFGLDWGTDGFDWYVGGGFSLGFWNDYTYNHNHNPFDDHNHNAFYLGVSGIIGLEYTIPGIPLNFSIDAKPTIGYRTVGVWGAGSVRYVLN